MLRDRGATHVIVGHSERRADCGETDAMVRAKADADDRQQARPPRRLRLGAHDGVGLAAIGAPLGVADDHVARAAVAQHLGGDLAGMGAARLGVAVLPADQNAASLRRLGHRQDQRRRRADQHLAVAPARLLHAVGDGLGQRQAIGR